MQELFTPVILKTGINKHQNTNNTRLDWTREVIFMRRIQSIYRRKDVNTLDILLPSTIRKRKLEKWREVPVENFILYIATIPKIIQKHLNLFSSKKMFHNTIKNNDNTILNRYRSLFELSKLYCDKLLCNLTRRKRSNNKPSKTPFLIYSNKLKQKKHKPKFIFYVDPEEEAYDSSLSNELRKNKNIEVKQTNSKSFKIKIRKPHLQSLKKVKQNKFGNKYPWEFKYKDILERNILTSKIRNGYINEYQNLPNNIVNFNSVMSKNLDNNFVRSPNFISLYNQRVKRDTKKDKVKREIQRNPNLPPLKTKDQHQKWFTRFGYRFPWQMGFNFKLRRTTIALNDQQGSINEPTESDMSHPVEEILETLKKLKKSYKGLKTWKNINITRDIIKNNIEKIQKNLLPSIFQNNFEVTDNINDSLMKKRMQKNKYLKRIMFKIIANLIPTKPALEQRISVESEDTSEQEDTETRTQVENPLYDTSDEIIHFDDLDTSTETFRININIFETSKKPRKFITGETELEKRNFALERSIFENILYENPPVFKILTKPIASSTQPNDLPKRIIKSFMYENISKNTFNKENFKEDVPALDHLNRMLLENFVQKKTKIQNKTNFVDLISKIENDVSKNASKTVVSNKVMNSKKNEPTTSPKVHNEESEETEEVFNKDMLDYLKNIIKPSHFIETNIKVKKDKFSKQYVTTEDTLVVLNKILLNFAKTKKTTAKPSVKRNTFRAVKNKIVPISKTNKSVKRKIQQNFSRINPVTFKGGQEKFLQNNGRKIMIRENNKNRKFLRIKSIKSQRNVTRK